MTWCVHTMEYYAAVKKDKRLPSATTRMGLEGALLSEKAKTNTARSHSRVEDESKPVTHTQIQRTDWRSPEGKGLRGGPMGEEGRLRGEGL